jgi:hypothetical protein
MAADSALTADRGNHPLRTAGDDAVAFVFWQHLVQVIHSGGA